MRNIGGGLAWMHPILVVCKGNSGALSTYHDLIAPWVGFISAEQGLRSLTTVGKGRFGLRQLGFCREGTASRPVPRLPFARVRGQLLLDRPRGEER